MNKFVNYEGLTFDDVLIEPKYSIVKSRSDCDILSSWGVLPFIPANMSTISGPKIIKFISGLGGIGILHRYMSVSEMVSFTKSINDFQNGYIFISVGTLDNDKERIDKILEINKTHAWCLFNICIDIANGNCQAMVDTIKYIRDSEKKRNIDIIAGNVATSEATKRLQECGADIIKVGIGSGSVCSTRIKTGIGVPQLTALMNCAENGFVIADGGFKYPGDMVKALACHRNVIGVMSGSFFAGTDLTPGWKGYGKIMEYAGMASKEEQIKFKGKFANAEGISVKIKGKPKGSTKAVIEELSEGLKSAMSYVGVNKLTDFANEARFIKVSSHTPMENIPHFGLHKK